MIIFLVIVLLFIFAVLLAITLPLRLSVRVKAGVDSVLDAGGRLMLLNGLAGGGLRYRNSVFHLSLFILSWKIIESDITNIIDWSEKRVRSRMSKKDTVTKAETGKTAKSFGDRLSSGLKNLKKFNLMPRKALKIMGEIVRFDSVVADITFGLGNPALTGILSGALFAINSLLPPRYIIRPSYDFTREVIRGEVSADMTVFSHRIWKLFITHVSDIIRFAQYEMKRKNDIITQEA